MKIQISESRITLSTNRTDSLCTVCKINEANYVNLPCSHLTTCQQCLRKQGQFKCCHICDEYIGCYLHVFV